MENDYQKALNFWNEAYAKYEGQETTEKFVDSELFNGIIKQYINESSNVLDFGCGSGWGLMEMYLTKPFKQGLGIDTADQSIRFAKQSAEKSNFKVLDFEVGNQELLINKKETFDFILSVNTLDVVPDDVTFDILDKLSSSLKKDAYALICLNPHFTEDELVNTLKMEKRGQYYYKNDILRCNYKSPAEWVEILSKYFTVIDNQTFKLMKEEPYARELYLVKK